MHKALVFLLFFASSLLPGQNFQPRIGHVNPPTHISTSADGQRILTGSDDGILALWSLESLLGRVVLGDVSLVHLELSPDGEVAAAVVRNRSGGYLLTAFNMEEHRRLFSVSLEDRPLSLGYSPDSTILALSYANWDSVELHSASTGRGYRGLSSGFGIVDQGFISTSNSTFMGYQSSQGLLTYHRIQNSQELARVSTVAGLEDIQLHSNKRIAFGRRGNEVFILDAVDGKTYSQKQYPGLTRIHLVSDGLLGLVLFSEGSFRSAWLDVTDFTLDDLGPTSRIVGTRGRTETLAGTGIVVDAAGGGLRIVSPDLDRILNSFEIRPIDQVVRIGGQVLVASTLGLVHFPEQEVFDQLDVARSLSAGRLTRIPLPFQGNPGIGALDSERALVWNSSGPSRVWQISFLPGQSEPEMLAVSEVRTKAISRIKPQGEYTIIFYQDNSLEVVDGQGFRRVAEYTTVGLQDAIVFNNEFLIIAKSIGGSLHSSLIRVNLRTLETASVADDDRLVFRIAHVPGDQDFFTLGISPVTQGENTQLRRYTRTSGSQFRTGTPLRTNTGEDLRATLSAGSGRILTTLGAQRLGEWDGRRIVEFDASDSIPRSIIDLDEYTATINLDGSLSLWELASRDFAGQVHLLRSGDLLLLGSQRSAVLLSLSDAPVSREQLESYLVATPQVLASLRPQSGISAPEPEVQPALQADPSIEQPGPSEAQEPIESRLGAEEDQPTGQAPEGSGEADS